MAYNLQTCSTVDDPLCLFPFSMTGYETQAGKGQEVNYCSRLGWVSLCRRKAPVKGKGQCVLLPIPTFKVVMPTTGRKEPS